MILGDKRLRKIASEAVHDALSGNGNNTKYRYTVGKPFVGEEYTQLDSAGLTQINELHLSRILKHGENGFVIVSASKSDIKYNDESLAIENEYSQWLMQNHREPSENSKKMFLILRNNAADKELLKQIKNVGYAFSKTYGGYRDTNDNVDFMEHSFIIYNYKRPNWNKSEIIQGDFEKLKAFALKVCAEFKQDSVFVQAPNEAPHWLNKNGDIVDKRSSKSISFNNLNQMYFTTDKRKKRTTDYKNGLKNYPQRFTSDIEESEAIPDEYRVFENMCIKPFGSFRDKQKRLQEHE